MIHLDRENHEQAEAVDYESVRKADRLGSRPGLSAFSLLGWLLFLGGVYGAAQVGISFANQISPAPKLQSRFEENTWYEISEVDPRFRYGFANVRDLREHWFREMTAAGSGVQTLQVAGAPPHLLLPPGQKVQVLKEDGVSVEIQLESTSSRWWVHEAMILK